MVHGSFTVWEFDDYNLQVIPSTSFGAHLLFEKASW